MTTVATSTRRSVAVAILFAALGAGASARAQSSGDAADRDHDGIPDAQDLCPDAAETRNGVDDVDGCPDADSDHDGVSDDYDSCPGEAETVNGFEDADGCPDTVGAELRHLGERILFATGRAALNGAGMRTLTAVQMYMVRHPEVVRLTIEGHADSRGDPTANQTLSDNRAATVRNALVSAGIDPNRLTAVGMGALAGDSPAIRSENRRVNFAVTEMQGQRVAAPVDLAPFAGQWTGFGAIDLTMARALGDVRATIRPGAPAWLGPAGSQLRCYAARRVSNRLVLQCNGVGVDVSMFLVRNGTAGGGWLISSVRGGGPAIAWSGTFACTPGETLGTDGCAAGSNGGCASTASPAHVHVDSLRTWQPSGVHVASGTVVTISARGQVHACATGNCADGCYMRRVGPDGTQCPLNYPDLLPTVPLMALIGRIGGGAPFLVGASRSFSADATGELFFATNDSNFEDNGGSFEADISLQCSAASAPPAQSAASSGRNWREDFTNPGHDGHDWGTALTVVRDTEGHAWLTSTVPETHRAAQSIRLGSNFVFGFDWTAFDYRDAGTTAPWVRIPVTFTMLDGRRFRIEVGNWGLALPGRQVVDFNEGDVNHFGMERRGDRIRCFFGTDVIAEATYPGLDDFTGFEIEIPVRPDGVGQRVTAFTFERLEPARTTTPEPAPRQTGMGPR